MATDPQEGERAVIAGRHDPCIDSCVVDDVRLYVYRAPGDGLALYVEPVEYPADRFRLFLAPRGMVRLAWRLVVGAIRWRNERPWDAELTDDERDRMVF